MITKLDWISFSFLVGQGDPIMPHRLTQVVLEALYDFSAEAFEQVSAGLEFEQRSGRAPYSVGFLRSDNGCTLFAHPNLPHALVELTGRGCELLAQRGATDRFLAAVADRLTRLDIACDMLCDTDPLAFSQLRDEGRFKTHSEFVSDSGATCYVGSRTSNRYARVYRYNPPHERAHLLRAEHVVKAQDAKNTAQAILSDGLPAVATTLGSAFGWSHPVWNTEGQESAEIAVWKPERREGKTLYWLNDTVAKTLVRLHKAGVIDVDEWLRDVVRSKLTSSADD